MTARALCAAVVLAAAAATRAETLRCEFSGGSINSGVFNVVKKQWAWMEPRSPAEFYKGVKPGASFFYATATYTPGERFGALAGSFSVPATDARTAEVAFGAGFVSLVDITAAGSILTLTVATERDRDGRYSAAYSSHAGNALMILVSQYWGSCR